MQKVLHILSQAWSIILYPMLMPLYGMVLFCIGAHRMLPMLSGYYMAMCISGTAVLTLIIPMVILLIIWKKGYIDSLHIDNAKQRTIPYIYTLMCYGFWAYFVGATVKLPKMMLLVAIGAIVALAAVTIINRWWKISAHLTGLGGLLGGICSFALYYSTMPLTVIIGVLLAALLLMYARLYVNAHTPLQVVSGFLLGLLCTFIPTCILNYA